jgi:predicted Zn-dependent protease with MMP-like domain
VQVGEAVARILAELPADVRAELGRVRVEVASRPETVDIERGCTPEHVAYFWGVRRELEPAGAALPADDPPIGIIRVFLRNLAPVTFARLRETLLHEVAHVLGHDEDEIVNVMGYAPCS